MFSFVASVFLAIVGLVDPVYAFTVTAPTANQQVSLADPFLIEWTLAQGDPAQISIDLLNATASYSVPILQNIAHDLNSTALQVNVTWPYAVPNDTATYQLYFIATASGDDIANSGDFNLTLPAGETRGQAEGTVGPYGSHPSTDSAPSATPAPSNHLSGGAIAGIVIGVLAVLSAVLGAFLFHLRRGAKRRAQQDSADQHAKPELGDTGVPSNEKRATLDTITSTELGSDSKFEMGSPQDEVDYLRFELPTTPPPVELPDTEVAAAEMDAASLEVPPSYASPRPEEEGVSEVRDSVSVVSAASPPLQPTPMRPLSSDEPRPSFQSGGRAASVSSVAGSSRPRREMTFAEALHEIVSEELRRKAP